ncbi:MAG: hypothetical protein U5L96_20310 [Owenweeksia sp.]|nr:hypothetical protein [Owenweeksia sp.]
MESKKDDTSENPASVQIPAQGNLGLLAYGHKGVRAWRMARKRARENNAKPIMGNS